MEMQEWKFHPKSDQTANAAPHNFVHLATLRQLGIVDGHIIIRKPQTGLDSIFMPHYYGQARP